MSPTAEAIEAKVKKAAEPKPLPALASPTVNLPDEIRQAIAIRCRDTDKSFSIVTCEMWIDLLKKEKRVPAELTIDLTPKRVAPGARFKEKETEYQTAIATLKAEIEKLKAAKK